MDEEEEEDSILDFGVGDNTDSIALGSNNLAHLYIDAESKFDEGEYEVALMRYLQVFDGSREVVDWQEKRLTDLLADIAALADVYEPALQTLIIMRDEREDELLKASNDLNRIHEWAALNRQLDRERTLTVYFKLKEEGEKYAEALSLIRIVESSRLLAKGLYAELDKATLEHLQQKLEQYETDLLTPKLAVDASEEEQEEALESAMEAMVAAALELFEAAAALKEGDIGRQTMNKYLSYDQPNSYAKLIAAAKKAKNSIWIDGLEKLSEDHQEDSA
ncbi:hypothetical protein BH11CYA1_BH11CYA1_41330 [soil metagenome]